MIKRPLNSRFSDAVREGRKVTTIRSKPWPVDKPIMLYNWSGAAYRSKQADVCAVMVLSTTQIEIGRVQDGAMVYAYSTRGDESLVRLWQTEGFESQADMDAWFSELLKPGQSMTKHLMRFERIS